MKNTSRKPKLKPVSNNGLQKLLDQSKTKTKAFEKLLRFLENMTSNDAVKEKKGNKE